MWHNISAKGQRSVSRRWVLEITGRCRRRRGTGPRSGKEMLSSSGELPHFQPLRVTSPTLKLGTVRHGEMKCFIQSLSQVLPPPALGEGSSGVSLSKPSPLSPHSGSASPLPPGKTLGLLGLENLLRDGVLRRPILVEGVMH